MSKKFLVKTCEKKLEKILWRYGAIGFEPQIEICVIHKFDISVYRI